VPLWMLTFLAPIGEHVGRWVGSDMFTKASVSALVENSLVDGGKAERELAYAPRSLNATIEDLVHSFDPHGRPRHPA